LKVYLDNCCLNRPFDSLHLSVAEQNADYFLTTDVRLIRASARADLLVKVMNPIQFIMEVMSGE
jgi:predicted nucleic acid-binding protein